jgi:hypothetical protein
MLRIHSRQFTFDHSNDDSLGSETRILPAGAEPPAEAASADDVSGAAPASSSQLDRIEHHLSEVVRMVESLQRRIDAIDSTLARIVNRQR